MWEKSIPSYRVFSILIAAFIVGVFVASYFRLDFYLIYFWFLFLALLIIAISIFFWRNKLVVIFAASTIFFLGGFLLFIFDNTKLDNLQLPFGEDKEFLAEIISYPVIGGNSQAFFAETSNFGRPIKIYLKTSAYPNYSYGDEIKMKTVLQKPTNFSDFDWVDYLKRYGTVATSTSNPAITLVGKAGGNKYLKCLYFIRGRFEQAVQNSLPEPESSLAAGLLIGSKQGFSDSLLSDFSRSGITHIIALSGYNVTIIIIFLTDIFLGYISRRNIFILSSILIGLFIAMTGAASSVLRAAIITLLIAFGKTIGRRADMTNLILLSAAIMLAINPFVLRYDTGFQLSFLAFIGLVYVSPIISRFFDRKTFMLIPAAIKSVVTETLSAQIAVLPLILSVFGLVSVIAPATNILILPIIPATMLFIFLSTIIYWLAPAIGQLAFLICYLPLKYIVFVAQKFSSFSWSALTISDNWQKVIIATYLLLISVWLIKTQTNVNKKTG